MKVGWKREICCATERTARLMWQSWALFRVPSRKVYAEPYPNTVRAQRASALPPHLPAGTGGKRSRGVFGCEGTISDASGEHRFECQRRRCFPSKPLARSSNSGCVPPKRRGSRDGIRTAKANTRLEVESWLRVNPTERNGSCRISTVPPGEKKPTSTRVRRSVNSVVFGRK